MWVLDASAGTVKQFAAWDVAPANVRSYGLTEFVDLDRDGREDFLCIANFAQHHEVLLNRGGKLEKAWHHGWDESVTTGKVATTWPLPAHADIDGDGRTEVVVSMYNAENEGGWMIRVYDALTGELKYRQ
ncbi:MAG: VCBS repeat-containing protein, partial [Planctomycetota bacterium]|nr:VCBS repeat-containing protein [Planctomycetota bacterium]